jgi:hypothetical protein
MSNVLNRFFFIADSKLNIAIVSALWIILGKKIFVFFYKYTASEFPLILVTCDCRNVHVLRLLSYLERKISTCIVYLVVER